MNQILGYFKHYFKHEFHVLFHSSALLAIALMVYLFHVHDIFSFADNCWELSLIGYIKTYLFYFLPYFSIILVAMGIDKKTQLLKKPVFWFYILFWPGIFTFNKLFHFHHEIIRNVFTIDFHAFYRHCANNLKSLIFIFLPIVILYQFPGAKPAIFFGITRKNVKLTPYLVLLLAMVPLIIAASFNQSFTQYYPRLNYAIHNLPQGWERTLYAILFELCYGWDFVATELLFRGVLVIGMVRFLGPKAIMPMVVVYCMIHFGKPLGETISSVFGGFILGVIACYSKNIWGGIAIHLGIAWMMEIAAIIAHKI